MHARRPSPGDALYSTPGFGASLAFRRLSQTAACFSARCTGAVYWKPLTASASTKCLSCESGVRKRADCEQDKTSAEFFTPSKKSFQHTSEQGSCLIVTLSAALDSTTDRFHLQCTISTLSSELALVCQLSHMR
uniref:Uncharacterized protein n=1 Tax=Knipowitschia caucasica TaxID=637954 RepID=A0AAV2KY17_KNICA